MKFELRDDEAEVLGQALESYLAELGTEISHTDTKDFRDGLKRKRDLLQGILDRLRPAGA